MLNPYPFSPEESINNLVDSFFYIYDMSNYYVYIYLDPRKPGKYNYLGYNFEFEPFYVGKGTKSRILRHLKEVDRNPLKVNKISKIKREGHSPIIIKLVSGLTDKEAIEIEERLIKSIGRIITKTGPLTNIPERGSVYVEYKHKQEYIEKLYKPVIKYDLDGNIIEEYGSVKEAGEKNQVHPQTISQICGGGIKIWKDKYIFLYKDDVFNKRLRIKKEYPVKRIDYNGDEVIYRSITQAAEKNNLRVSDISSSCLGNSFQSGGYLWRFTEHRDKEYIDNRISQNYDKYLKLMNYELIDSRNGKIYKNILHAISSNKNLKINNLISLINKKIYRFNEYTRYKNIL